MLCTSLRVMAQEHTMHDVEGGSADDAKIHNQKGSNGDEMQVFDTKFDTRRKMSIRNVHAAS